MPALRRVLPARAGWQGPCCIHRQREGHEILLVTEEKMTTLLDPFAVSLVAGISIGMATGWGTIWLLGWLRD